MATVLNFHEQFCGTCNMPAKKDDNDQCGLCRVRVEPRARLHAKKMFFIVTDLLAQSGTRVRALFRFKKVESSENPTQQ